jgi:hypothetical protein
MGEILNKRNFNIFEGNFIPNGSFQKRSILPPRRKFPPSGGGGEKKLFLRVVNVLGHPKGVGGLTSYFLRGGGMDVFWNDPIRKNKDFLIFESGSTRWL